MLRATKLLSICFFLTLVFANVGQVQAQSTYELGPFMAIGTGSTPELAEENAYEEAWVIVEAMSEVIPEGHAIIDFVIENEELVTNNTYFIEFHLVVEYDPTPPGGGGGGSGGPGA